jgi:hypothetical protein
MGDGAGDGQRHAAQLVVDFRFATDHVDAAVDAGIAGRVPVTDPPSFSAALREVLAGSDEEWDRLDRATAARQALHDLLGARAAEALGTRARWQSCAPFPFHVGDLEVAGEAELRRLAWEVHRAFAEPLAASLPAIRPAIGGAVDCAGVAETRRSALAAVDQSRLLGEPSVIGRAHELDLLTDLRCRRSALLGEVALHLAAGRTSVIACAVDGMPPDADPREHEAVARGVARVLEQHAGATLFTTAAGSYHAVVPWSAEHAARAAEDVRTAVATYRGYFFNLDDICWEYPELGETVRVSLGVAAGFSGDDPAGLLDAADVALAEAAAAGDRVVVTGV